MAPELGLTPESLQRLEQQWVEAMATARRAERVYEHLCSTGDEAETLTSAACLALWRAQERQRALEFRLCRVRS
jgi:hypothetical protein